MSVVCFCQLYYTFGNSCANPVINRFVWPFVRVIDVGLCLLACLFSCFECIHGTCGFPIIMVFCQPVETEMKLCVCVLDTTCDLFKQIFLFFGWFFCVPQLYLWGSPLWVRFLRMWLFFNPTIKVVTFRLRGWCVLGVFFVAGIHSSRTWTSGSFESVRWNACMHRLDLGLYSHPKEFWGEWSLNPC